MLNIGIFNQRHFMVILKTLRLVGDDNYYIKGNSVKKI